MLECVLNNAEVARKTKISNPEFLKRVREYLPADALVLPVEPGEAQPGLPLDGLAENTFYQFDGEAVLAFSRAIEDLALDEASGRLLATCQEVKNFETQREEYWQLAATIDEVVVIVTAQKPRRHGRLKFVSATAGLEPFWAVIYRGSRNQVMIICREMTHQKRVEESRFVGFYSFDPKLIQRLWAEIEAALADGNRKLTSFERALAVEKSIKEVCGQFRREGEELCQMLARLPIAGPTKKFTTQFDKSIQRLTQLKSRLSGWLQPFEK